MLPYVQRLVDAVKAALGKIRALKPADGKHARVAQPHDEQVRQTSALGDQIAAELVATACSGTGA